MPCGYRRYRAGAQSRHDFDVQEAHRGEQEIGKYTWPGQLPDASTGRFGAVLICGGQGFISGPEWLF